MSRRPADIARAYEFGALATAAQLVGAGQAMLDASVEYAKQRSQFGRAIGSYQAIKHKLADVHIAVELARPLVYGAALSLADGSPDTARDVSAAKVAAADAALLAARSSLQTHGAIGFTQEHDLSLLLLRVQALRSAWGDPTLAPAPGAGGPLTMSEERRTAARHRRRAGREARVARRGARRRWSPNAVTTSRCGRCCASRSAPRRWWCPRNWAAPAANSPMRRSCSRSSGKALVPTPLLGTTLAELALLAADEPDADALEGLAEGTSIGAVVFDPGLRGQRRHRRRRGRRRTANA